MTYLCLLSIDVSVLAPVLWPALSESCFVLTVVLDNYVMALKPHQEGILAIVPHEAFGCFFVPNSNSKKWFYAITLEPLYPGQKLGIVLDLENERKAIKANELKKSVDRLIDTSLQVGKAFAQSEYVKQFVDDGIRNRLLALYIYDIQKGS